MKRAPAVLICLCLACSAFAGFKVKLIRPKNPDKFQTHLIAGAVTYAADLVITEKDQKIYFYKELAPARVMAIRLALFNQGREEIVLPLDKLRLLDPSGQEIAPVEPAAVAEAVLQGLVVAPESKNPNVAIGTSDPRYDPTDPRNDPNDPRRRYPPVIISDPTDPRIGRYPRTSPEIVLNPGGGGSGDLSQHERSLVEKDFTDKAHSVDPVPASSVRDKFLFFAATDKLQNGKGWILRLPPAKGMKQEILLKF